MRFVVGARVLIFAALALAMCATPLRANFIAPSGLAPGSQYQVIILSWDTVQAYSDDIAVYNEIAATEAASGVADGLPGGHTWHAVVSTPTVDARDNAPSVNIPVYNSQGQLVSVSGLYSGTLVNPILYTADGTPPVLWNAAVWTGSDPYGVGVPGHTLGDPSGLSMLGSPAISNAYWSTRELISQNNGWAIYALSDPITVPVPEPGTLALLGSAIVTCCAAMMARTRRTAR